MRSIQLESTGFLRRSTAPMDGQGGLRFSYGPIEAKVGSSAAGVVHHAVANAFGVKQTVCSRCSWCSRCKGFQGPCAPRGACENLICAQSFKGVAERCRQEVAGFLREFIMKDNHEALNISGLQGNSVIKRVIMPKFDLETNLDAAVQEGSDDLTFRLQEKESEMSLIDTGVVKSGATPVKEDWHARCQVLYIGIEASDWKSMHRQFTGMGKALDVQQPARSQRPRCSLAPCQFQGPH